MNLFKACLLGLGNIGYQYDKNIKNKNIVLTHFKAMQKFKKNIKILSVVDQNNKNLKRFENNINVRKFNSIDLFLKHKNEENLAIVCTGKYSQVKIKKKLAQKKNIRNIICEKPLSYNLKSAKELINLSRKYNLKIFVNFQRRFNPSIISLKESLSKKKLGKISKIFFWYGSTLENGGCHFIDVALFLFGNPLGYKIIDKTNIFSPDFSLTYNNFKIYFFHNNNVDFEIGKFEIYTNEYFVRYEDDAPLYIFKKFKNDIYKKEYKLKFFEKRMCKKNFNIRYFYKNIIYQLLKNKPIDNLKSSIECMELINNILKK